MFICVFQKTDLNFSASKHDVIVAVNINADSNCNYLLSVITVSTKTRAWSTQYRYVCSFLDTNVNNTVTSTIL